MSRVNIYDIGSSRWGDARLEVCRATMTPDKGLRFGGPTVWILPNPDGTGAVDTGETNARKVCAQLHTADTVEAALALYAAKDAR